MLTPLFSLLQLLHRKTRGLPGSSSEPEAESARKEGGLKLKTNGGQTVYGQRRE